MPSICATCHAFLDEEHGCEHIPDPYAYKRHPNMEEAVSYNGWSNRETWAVSLHLSNNEGDYRAAYEAADRFIESDPEEAISKMADWIQNWVEEVYESVLHQDEYPPTDEAKMLVADVGSWWRVNFWEIADGWIYDAKERIS